MTEDKFKMENFKEICCYNRIRTSDGRVSGPDLSQFTEQSSS